MAKRKLNPEDKSAPGVGFILLFPAKFSVASKISQQKRINDFCKKYKISKATLVKLPLLSFYGCKNENEILEKYVGVRKGLETWKNEQLLNELGLEDKKSFSQFITEKLDIIMPLLETKLKGKEGKYIPIEELLELIKEDKK